MTVPEVKFCGLTRSADAAEAARAGASWAGMIFAGGPRHLTLDAARTVANSVPGGVGRVGVFADADPDSIGVVGTALGLAAVQLHGDPSPGDVVRVREATGCAVWAVLRVRGSELPGVAAELFAAADAVVLDAHVPGSLGGTGTVLPWNRLASSLYTLRNGARARLVLAGGLRPENVASAIDLLSPDVVDVSSGVESAPGIKDHARMHAFAAAARGRIIR